MQKRAAKKGPAKGSATPKKARPSRPCNDGKGNPVPVEEEDTTDVFRLDMDTLQCDICCKPFESQVYSCKNGHAACGSCCVAMGRKCPFCSESIGDFRCRATEKIIAGMTKPCRYAKNGCPEEALKFADTRAHEENACRHAPYRCPFDGCGYLGQELYGHIQGKHTPGGATSAMGLLRRMTVKLPRRRRSGRCCTATGRASSCCSTAGTSSRAARSPWSVSAPTRASWRRRKKRSSLR